MIVSKRDSTSIYNGCLSYLKNEITSKLPDDRTWNDGKDVKYIINNKDNINVVNVPYTLPPTYFEIYFGNKYIFPTEYSLQGRIVMNCNLLKGWNFFGKDVRGHWVILSSYSNSQFSQSQIRTFPLKANELYNGFKIQMTEPDSNGAWALCLGQIEVFGDIYSRPFIKKLTCQQRKCIMTNISFMILLLIKINI